MASDCETIIIDMRSRHSYEREHIAGSFNIPYYDWCDRRMELPPRRVPLVLIYDNHTVNDDVMTGEVCLRAEYNPETRCYDAIPSDIRRPHHVAEMSETQVRMLNGTVTARELKSCPIPNERSEESSALCVALVHFRFAAEVKCVVNASDPAAWAVWKDLLVSDPHSSPSSACSPRMWMPSSFMEHVVGHTRATFPAAVSDGSLRVLDIGCGLGRNAASFVEELPRTVVWGVDNRDKIIERSVKFVKRLKLERSVHFYVGDASDAGFQSDAVSRCGSTFHVVLLMRFMHKTLLQNLRACLSSDGPSLLAVEAFHTSAPHPIDPTQTIEEGEVLRLVRTQMGAEQLVEERAIAEDGRPLLRVLLRITPGEVV